MHNAHIIEYYFQMWSLYMLLGWPRAAKAAKEMLFAERAKRKQ